MAEFGKKKIPLMMRSTVYLDLIYGIYIHMLNTLEPDKGTIN